MKKYRIIKYTGDTVLFIPQRKGLFGWSTLQTRDFWGSDIECETLTEAEIAIERDRRGVKFEVVKEIG